MAGKTYTTDTTIRISGLIDNPNFQIAIGAVTADNYTLGDDNSPNSENINWWKSDINVHETYDNGTKGYWQYYTNVSRMQLMIFLLVIAM